MTIWRGLKSCVFATRRPCRQILSALSLPPWRTFFFRLFLSFPTHKFAFTAERNSTLWNYNFLCCVRGSSRRFIKFLIPPQFFFYYYTSQLNCELLCMDFFTIHSHCIPFKINSRSVFLSLTHSSWFYVVNEQFFSFVLLLLSKREEYTGYVVAYNIGFPVQDLPPRRCIWRY